MADADDKALGYGRLLFGAETSFLLNSAPKSCSSVAMVHQTNMMKMTFKQKTKVARPVTSVSCRKKKTKLARPGASISSHTGGSSSIVIHHKSKWREELLAAASQLIEDAASETDTETEAVVTVLRNKKPRLLLETKAILGNNKRVRDLSYAASETEAMSGIKKERLRNVRSCCRGLKDFYNSQDCDIFAEMKAEMKADIDPEIKVEMKAEIEAEMARRQAEMARGEDDMATWEARMETMHTRLGEKLDVLIKAWMKNWDYRMEEKLKARWIEDKMKAMMMYLEVPKQRVLLSLP